MNSKDTKSLNRESKEEPLPPSLDLAFDWVKNVLDEQGHMIDGLDAKAATLFAVATSIIGLGLGISMSVLRLPLMVLFSSVFGWLVFISYGFIAVLSVLTLWVRSFEALRNPIIIRQWYWDMPNSKFRFEILAHLENAYSTNEKTLFLKGWVTRLLVPIVALEALFLVLLLGFML